MSEIKAHSKPTKIQKEDWFLILLICGVCILLMLPRILSAHFGLLDDAVLLLNSVQTFRDAGFILRGFRNAGRFIPTILTFRAAAFYFSGFDPQRWYLWQTFLLIIVCLELVFIVRRYATQRVALPISLFIFLASPALIENFYTLSKSETYLVLLVSGAILMTASYPSIPNRLARIVVLCLMALLLLLVLGTKETALVLPFIFVAWLLISWFFFRKSDQYWKFLQGDVILVIASLLSGVAYLAIRKLLGLGDVTAHSYSGEYQLFNLPKLYFNFRNLLGWLLRDYIYLLPMFLAVLFLKPLQQSNIIFGILRWGVWMMAWLATLLPWGFLAYYFLPFIFGTAIISGTILGQMLWLLGFKHLRPSHEQSPALQPVTIVQRYWIGVLCLATFLCMIPPAINATAYATEQVTIDQANWQFVKEVSNLPLNSRVLINIPPDMEYFYEIQLYTGRILDRQDISIEPYQSLIVPEDGRPTYIASPIFLNQILPRVRAIDGTSVTESRQVLLPVTTSLETIYSYRIERPLLDIGLHRLLFFLDTGDMMGYSERDIFAKTNLVYGWDMWKYAP